MRLLFAILLYWAIQIMDVSTSPDGRFKLTLAATEVTDLQTKYSFSIHDIKKDSTKEISICLRHDLGKPNFYWDKDSKFLIVESCSDDFKEGRILIVDLNSLQIVFEIVGLIGNTDISQQQFDSENNILLYFDTSNQTNVDKLLLYSFDVKARKKRHIHDFILNDSFEFPLIKRSGKRTITVEFNDAVSGQMTRKVLNY